jgi:hypothetical protein
MHRWQPYGYIVDAGGCDSVKKREPMEIVVAEEGDPAEFPLGSEQRIVVVSVTEGSVLSKFRHDAVKSSGAS